MSFSFLDCVMLLVVLLYQVSIEMRVKLCQTKNANEWRLVCLAKCGRTGRRQDGAQSSHMALEWRFLLIDDAKNTCLRAEQTPSGDVLRRMHEQKRNIGHLALETGLNITDCAERKPQPLIEADSALGKFAAGCLDFQNSGYVGLREICAHDTATDAALARTLAYGEMLDKAKPVQQPMRDEADDFIPLGIDQYFVFAFAKQRFRIGKTAVLLQWKRLLHQPMDGGELVRLHGAQREVRLGNLFYFV